MKSIGKKDRVRTYVSITDERLVLAFIALLIMVMLLTCNILKQKQVISPIESGMSVKTSGTSGMKTLVSNRTKATLKYERDTKADSAYIVRFAKVAQVEMKKFGIPASISLAQGLVESNAGRSDLAKKANNHFGYKCFSKKCRKGHCANFSDDTHKDFFIKYKTPWQSWRNHSELLAGGARYMFLFDYGKDYRKWAHGLKQAGYATDPEYADKLIKVIVDYKLFRLDG